MNTENENIDIFEIYLKNELSSEELSDFEERLISDASFKKEFEEYKSIKLGLKKHYRKELKAKLSEVDHRLDTPKKKLLSINWYLVSGIAAILVIGLFVFNNQSNSSFDLVAKYWPYEAGLPVKMNEKNKYDKAMNAFKFEDWKKAEKILKPIDSDTSDYYLGVITYELENYSSSLKYFKNIDSTSYFYDEAQFRLALISILQDDLVLAKGILQEQIKKETTFALESKNILVEIE